MSTLTEHSRSHIPRRPTLQLADATVAAEPGARYPGRPHSSARELRVFDAAAVILAAVALATLQAWGLRLAAIVVVVALLAKATAVGGRRWRTHRSSAPRA
jgi:hypothetical protein